ncbi:four-carbon acid sugar kinase family protein [Thermaerobacter sp. PB12/4term]|uniref:four-carbon acid sugar kinase family protein n=1 Tax=Thermaerobacter sp. PB12/4term TaxID=2293838 RepID=UPI000E32C7C2|nr:four-carbon acid sugar kinase family protein [Thermaerobacter sp. PB12/4term]QIA27799.1 four-carbon acid sugar kinase family protein [Thermaerobacter sp. PB12/4term]
MFGLVADDVTGANATAARVAARAGIAGRVVLHPLPGAETSPVAGITVTGTAAAGLEAAGEGTGGKGVAGKGAVGAGETGAGPAVAPTMGTAAGPAPADPALLVVPTHSRAVEPAVARRRVRAAFQVLRRAGCRFFGKRIDSTLRGNLGAELAGALEALPGHMAVVVAAFPASGRTTVGGRLLVNGVPLMATEAARDPITPVTDDHVARLVATQSGLPAAYLPPDGDGYDHRLPERLRELHRAGTRVVVLDAARDADIETIAALVARARIPVLAVDPGPFFAAWVAHQLGEGGADPDNHGGPATSGSPAAPPASGESSRPVSLASQRAAAGGAGPWLVVAGSLTDLTQRQLAAVTRRWPVPRLHATLPQLLADPVAAAQTLLPQIEAALARWGVAVVETDRSAATTRPTAGAPAPAARNAGCSGAAIPEDLAQQVARQLGTLAATLVDRLPGLAGLVLTGGDTAAAVAAALGAGALRVTGELAPLVAAGSLEGGRRPGLAVITKGGLVGDEDLLVRLLEPRVRPLAEETAAGAEDPSPARGPGAPHPEPDGRARAAAGAKPPRSPAGTSPRRIL